MPDVHRAGSLLLADVEVDGRRVDVRIERGAVRELAAAGASATGDVDVVHGRGGALLPGLHDHHVHLLAAAAAARSVVCGPPQVRTPPQLRAVLRAAPGPEVRGVGYHESVAGDLDAVWLDEVEPRRPVRVQHRTGALWMLNSAALAALGAPSGGTGRLWRGDPLLAAVPPRRPGAAADVAAYGDTLLAWGVTGVADATPDLAPEAVALLERACLPQQVLLLGAPDGYVSGGGSLRAGPRKIVLADEHDLDVEALVERVRHAHDAGRPVALHTVTRASAVLAVVVLQQVGALPGDRLEHAAVLPADLLPAVRELGVTVVTQPALAAARGDEHAREVDPEDRDCLWRYASLLAAGVPVAPSSDAPYGPADPWEVLLQARDRRAPSGAKISPAERVPVSVALAGLLSPLSAPGGPARTVRAGIPADLVLLGVPLRAALSEPSAEHVRAVVLPA